MKTYFQLRSNLLSRGFLVLDIAGDSPALSAEGNGKRVTYWENRNGDSAFLVYRGNEVEGYSTEDGDEMWSIKDMLQAIGDKK